MSYFALTVYVNILITVACRAVKKMISISTTREAGCLSLLELKPLCEAFFFSCVRIKSYINYSAFLFFLIQRLLNSEVSNGRK